LQLEATLDADAVERLADELLEGLGHRRVVVEDEAHATRLEPALTARGWAAERLLLLARDGGQPPPDAPFLAEEVPYGHVRALRAEWLRSEPWANGEELVRQVLEADGLLFTATRTRAFAAFEAGRPLSYALLLLDGRDGMLEDVYTTPEARGRGLATSVIAAVLHAARGERCEAVFVPTEHDGRARALYERLGFAPAAVVHRFQRWVRA
jgi:GNAT superfamily N-acetyltransferase